MKYLLLFLIATPLGSSNLSEEYNAQVLSVYDGDTITCDIELGFNIHIVEKVRLHGIDAPEVRGAERPEGLVSRDALRNLIDGKEITVINKGKGKYGRTIGDLYLDTLSVSAWLVSNGYAEYRNY